MQINWLVSIWWETLVVNELKTFSFNQFIIERQNHKTDKQYRSNLHYVSLSLLKITFALIFTSH